MQYLDKAKIRFFDSMNETYKFVVNQYQQAKQVLTPASPYMQIITVLHNLAQTMLLYLEDAINENNIFKARKPDSVKGKIVLTGHNPTRANGAKGEIKFKLKAEKVSEIAGSYLIFPDKMVIKCKNNNKKYTVLLNKDRMLLSSSGLDYYYATLVQGEFDTQTFIGRGSNLQSFNVKSKKSTFIDDQYVFVYVNGEFIPKYEFFSDMPYNAKGCMVRTSLTSGIDIIFGNKSFGFVPADGSEIKVTYLETDGLSGNIYNNTNDMVFEWEESITDNLGNDIDLNEFFQTQLNTKVIFGTNPEDLRFSKIIAPNASRTNVLGNPDSYIYYFQKMNLFSVVDAYTTFGDDNLEDDHIIYLYLIPDVKRKLEESNYFKMPTTSFLLDDDEKKQILSNLNASKRMTPGSEAVITDPVIKKYITNIALRVFRGYDDASLKSEIVTKLSQYFLTIKRKDKIPKSDLIRIIERIDFIDSVYVEFVSVENETALLKRYYISKKVDANGIIETVVNLADGENPNLGLDEFGDIIINKGELPVIRGDFYDSNSTYYTELYEKDKLGPVNIFINEVIDKDLYYDILADKLESI